MSEETAPIAGNETLNALAARLHVTTHTVTRWVKYGVTVGGQRVKLAARRIGGRWHISREAWQAFEAACNPDTPTLPLSPAARQREIDAAMRELAAI